MHTIKITPNLLFEYQCRLQAANLSDCRIESNRNFFCPNWNALLCGRIRGTGGAAAWRRRHHVGRLTSVIVTLRPDSKAEYYDERVCLSAFVSLPVRDHIFGNTRPIFTSFLCMLSMAVARSSSGGVLIRQSSCTSGFMDDVIFAHHRPAAAVDRHERQTDGRTDGHQTVELRYTSPFTA